MNKENKKTKKLSTKKLKFVKETLIKNEIQFGSCTASSACWTQI